VFTKYVSSFTGAYSDIVLPGLSPIGPWLVTLDEIENPDDLELGCSVNGAEVQQGRTRAPRPGWYGPQSSVVPQSRRRADQLRTRNR
jgi:hypothetical protein